MSKKKVRYYTLPEIAKFVNVDIKTADAWRRKKKIPKQHHKVGKTRKWTHAQVTAIIKWRSGATRTCEYNPSEDPHA